jgi:hypothetical protein
VADAFDAAVVARIVDEVYPDASIRLLPDGIGGKGELKIGSQAVVVEIPGNALQTIVIS